jgi:hypothetical protein
MEAEQRKNAEPIQHYIKLIVEQKMVFEGVQGTQMCSGEHLLSYKGLFKQTAAAHGVSDEKVRGCVDKKKTSQSVSKTLCSMYCSTRTEQALEGTVVQEHTRAAR